jgi:predicted PurR-regulated permease PerM
MTEEIRSQKPQSARANIIFTFIIALAVYAAYIVRDVLVLVYVSALFAVVLMPVVRGIMRARIGKWQPGLGVSVLVLLLGVFGGIIIFVMFALPPVLKDLREFISELPTRGPELLNRVHKLPLAQRVNVAALNAKLQDFASNFATYIFFSVKNWASTLFKVITGVVLTVYFILEGESAYKWMLSFFPVDKRQRLDMTLRQAEVRMGKWLLGQGSLMLILGLSSTIVFVFLHVRYAYALGVLAGLLNVIPVAGALVSVALAVLVAAIDSWGRVVGVLIFYAIYQQVENSFLTPRIMRSSVDLAGLAVLISLLLGAEFAGIIGAMVAVPTAVLVAVLLDEYLVKSEPVIAEPKKISGTAGRI